MRIPGIASLDDVIRIRTLISLGVPKREIRAAIVASGASMVQCCRAYAIAERLPK